MLVVVTGQRPPYWVGCALGFLCVLAAAGAVCSEFAKLTNWLWVAPRALAVILVSSAAEITGVYTGWPFGVYSYTKLWLPLVPLPDGHRFPIALPLTWLVLAGAVVLLLGSQRWLLGGVLMALIDFALEPVLTGPVGFWRWKSGDPPFLNYVGWFLVGCVVCWILRLPSGVVPPQKFAGKLLIVILIGTLVIGVTHGEMRGLYALVPLTAVAALMPRKS